MNIVREREYIAPGSSPKNNPQGQVKYLTIQLIQPQEKLPKL